MALMNEAGLRPKRSLGQNFVCDPNTVRRVARLADLHDGDHVVEVGAGLGSLTLALAETGARVLALELDESLAELLRTVVDGLDVEVIEVDALRVDWPDLLLSAAQLDGVADARSVTWALVANLPYNVATPLVMNVLEFAPTISRLVVMVQREVADRMAAGPGDEAYGGVSAKIAYFATAKMVARVPPSVFVPRPKVESAIVELVRRPHPAVDPDSCSYQDVARLINAGFAQRRKMLRRSLEHFVDPNAFGWAGIEPTARAEELSIEDWGRLTVANDRRQVIS